MSLRKCKVLAASKKVISLENNLFVSYELFVPEEKTGRFPYAPYERFGFIGINFPIFEFSFWQAFKTFLNQKENSNY